MISLVSNIDINPSGSDCSFSSGICRQTKRTHVLLDCAQRERGRARVQVTKLDRNEESESESERKSERESDKALAADKQREGNGSSRERRTREQRQLVREETAPAGQTKYPTDLMYACAHLILIRSHVYDHNHEQ